MIYFIFSIHNHQPVGNFDSVLEEAYKNAYEPFLNTISKHPFLKLSFHTSGYLLDWLIEKRPQYIELMREMVRCGQVEIMGGGYYEPILPLIPENDRLSQIKMMSDRIESLFGARPRGIWLTERVWEPSLPSSLKGTGIEYAVLDDYHFKKSGLEEDSLGGYYITEDQGNCLKVFPGSERLRYLIPFEPVEKFADHIRSLEKTLANRPRGAAIYADDGEKFGVWPGTHKWVYRDGWLEKFLEKLVAAGKEGEEGSMRPVTFSEYIDKEEPCGRVYLPTTSYMEMGGWALPAEASRAYMDLVEEIMSWPDGARIRRFLQGGTWRNFLSKYPEANWMHKRMMLVSREVRERGEKAAGGDLENARRFLYRAQCNDAYWHGVFGGLYLPHLRAEVYKNLLKAESYLNKGKGAAVIMKEDFDSDSFEEVAIRAEELNLFFSPRHGGTLVETDFSPTAVNFSNTLSRWCESYHHRLKEGEKGALEGAKSIHDLVVSKEKGLLKYLKFDGVKRASFRDHFIKEDETLDAFSGGEYAELGDFFNSLYKDDISGRALILSRRGRVNGRALSVTKEFRITGSSSFSAAYTLENLSPSRISGIKLGVEFNFLLPCCNGPVCLYEFTPGEAGEDIGVGSSGELKDIEKVSLMDKLTGLRLTIVSDRKATLWRHPVETVSLSEAGFERIFQGSCLVFLFPLMLESKETMNLSFNIHAEKLNL